MGNKISMDKVAQVKNSSLIIYCGKVGAKEREVVPIEIQLAEELSKIPEKSRTLRMDSVMSRVIKQYPSGSIFEGLDVLFNPSYKIDVLKLLIGQRKTHNFGIVWPGILHDNSLIYSEPEYKDYKKYEISNYDITCVI